jgi:hypothetical protein
LNAPLLFFQLLHGTRMTADLTCFLLKLLLLQWFQKWRTVSLKTVCSVFPLIPIEPCVACSWQIDSKAKHCSATSIPLVSLCFVQDMHMLCLKTDCSVTCTDLLMATVHQRSHAWVFLWKAAFLASKPSCCVLSTMLEAGFALAPALKRARLLKKCQHSDTTALDLSWDYKFPTRLLHLSSYIFHSGILVSIIGTGISGSQWLVEWQPFWTSEHWWVPCGCTTV